MASPRVLLTGANGFIGSHIISHFLEKSVFVQAVVRSESKAKRVMSDFPSADRTKLDFSIVPDITAPGAFDKAIQEALPLDAIVHTASPFLYDEGLKVEDLIKPAINGTSEILKSTLKYGKGVKRVVVTSSFAAIGNPFDLQGNGRTYTSDDWNPITMEQATAGNNLRLAYWGSKTLAEKAAWDFMKANNPDFELVVLNPPGVFGPLANSIDSLKDLGTSNAILYNTFMKSSKSTPVPPETLHITVDVRDLAIAHYQAAFAPGVGNQRFLVTQGGNTNQEIADIVRKAVPEWDERIPLGNPGSHALKPELLKADNTKSREVLGVDYQGFEETIADSARNFYELEKTLGQD
ncbi:NAD(P)-binding protein [Exophiala viscosa]|uniref:NAD(P)-binding protein n=1 Tax=Exophiala viscosa TaxID=2486360 RepID=UPI00218E5E17|nr:NAD(P)-binding protein [Exophiala viscosa]